MSDTMDDFKLLRQHRKEQRELHGVDCPGCIKDHPKRIPTRLMPSQTCRVCGHTDPRGRMP